MLPAAFHSAGVGWGMAAGLFGMSALVVFYRALSTGSMAIVARSPRSPRPSCRWWSAW